MKRHNCDEDHLTGSQCFGRVNLVNLALRRSEYETPYEDPWVID
jgi:hypothetical protein